MPKYVAIDMIGKVIGRWEVLRRSTAERKCTDAYWECRCSCGTVRDVRGADLRNSSSTSCGCIAREINAQRFRDMRIYFPTNKFSTYTVESCYWAGFIAADGNISKNLSTITINLKADDIEHLYKFAKFLDLPESCARVYSFTDKKYNITRNICTIALTDKDIVQSLITNFNIVPVKSLVLTPPKLDNIQYMLAFICGYVDGNGSIGVGKYSYVLTIAGSNYIIPWIKDVLMLLYPDCVYKTRSLGKISALIVNTGITDLLKSINMFTTEISLPRKWKTLYA